MKRILILFASILLQISFTSTEPQEKVQSFCSQISCRELQAITPENLGTLKERIRHYFSSGTYEAAITCVANELTSYLQTLLPIGKQKLAIVFDIDETCLSNWDFILKNDFGYNKYRFRAWEMLGKAKAIKPMRAAYQFAINNGFAIFFLTGRREALYCSTKKNLIREGFKKWTHLYCKPNSYNGYSAIDYKQKARADIARKGYRIIANAGDQTSDLSGEFPGERSFSMPNPLYMIP